MIIEVAATGIVPDRGSTVRVEVRDTTFQDVAATTLATADGSATGGDPVAAVEIDTDADWFDPARSIDVFVHVDVEGTGELRSGDYLTTQSYPVAADTERVRVEVHRI